MGIGIDAYRARIGSRRLVSQLSAKNDFAPFCFFDKFGWVLFSYVYPIVLCMLLAMLVSCVNDQSQCKIFYKQVVFYNTGTEFSTPSPVELNHLNNGLLTVLSMAVSFIFNKWNLSWFLTVFFKALSSKRAGSGRAASRLCPLKCGSLSGLTSLCTYGAVLFSLILGSPMIASFVLALCTPTIAHCGTVAARSHWTWIKLSAHEMIQQRSPTVNFAGNLAVLCSIWMATMNLKLITISNPGIVNPGPNVPVVYHNCQGFIPFGELGKVNPQLDVTKVLEFQACVAEKKPGILVLNETWLSKNILSNELFPNQDYKVFRRDRSRKTHPPDPLDPKKFKRNGGGVLIAVRTDLDIESNLVKLPFGAEILSIEIVFKGNRRVCLTTCYRVGTLGAENHEKIDTYFKGLASLKKFTNYVVCGDFNLSGVSWPSGVTTKSLESKFLETFSDIGLAQLIEEPTHNQGRTLDLLLTNVPKMVSSVKVLGAGEVCSSDHHGIAFDLNINVKKKIPCKREIYNFKKADWDGLISDLKHVDWDSHLMSCVSDTAWRRFKAILLSLCDKHIPKIKIKSEYQPPWFDCETYEVCREKEVWRTKYKASGNPDHYKRYKECRAKFKFLSEEKMRNNFDDNDDPALISKKFWSHVKSTSNTSRIPETVSYGKKYCTSLGDQAELFNQFFADQFTSPSNYDISIDYQGDTDLSVSQNSVFFLLKTMNANKALGPDGIHGKILKNCATSLAYPLSLIFNTSLKTGAIPVEWKIANVVPVFKKGSKASVENYRPISLTCLTSKIFEKVVKKELLARCHHLINEKQHGFLNGKSCTTQMVPFVTDLALTLNDSSRTDVIYFDFAKAFDSVNHDVVLQKLKDNFKIDGSLLKLLADYLRDRQQCVVVGGTKSAYRTVTSGVPQGSILGPLLFVLFINDMNEVVHPDTSLLLYADDTKIYREIKDHNDHLILQNDINALHRWSQLNKMTFHPQKCKVLPVTLKTHSDWQLALPFLERFPYCLNGVCLDYVEFEKDLGVLVSSKLSWTKQCESLRSKASSRLGLLRRTCHFVKNVKQKRALYLALVRSQFEHCSVVWSPTSDAGFSLLESIQRRSVRWILSEPKLDFEYDSLTYLNKLKRLDILPLESKMAHADVSLFHRILYQTVEIKLPHYLKQVSQEALSRLRSDHRDSTYVVCEVDERLDVLSKSYFNRTYLFWNSLPSELRELEDYDQFQVRLKEHLWAWEYSAFNSNLNSSHSSMFSE